MVLYFTSSHLKLVNLPFKLLKTITKAIFKVVSPYIKKVYINPNILRVDCMTSTAIEHDIVALKLFNNAQETP